MKKIFILLTLLTATALLQAKGVYLIDHDVVKDNITGLLWTRCSLGESGMPDKDHECGGTAGLFTWLDAINACNNLSAIRYKGKSDWRLPNAREIQSIIVYFYFSDQRVNKQAFPNVMTNGHYWSSTTHKNNSGYAWAIDMAGGNLLFREKSDGTVLNDPAHPPIYVRCVAGP